ncbi:hypothetical protein ABXT08_14975 [Chryseobacterium sp. NRRL B-14859]|uniref:bacteriocin-like protein n=1 Tax=Chryseobacterium sp. NRRL B-14859 TaxID=1562763 RepID=UPI003394FB01
MKNLKKISREAAKHINGGAIARCSITALALLDGVVTGSAVHKCAHWNNNG